MGVISFGVTEERRDTKGMIDSNTPSSDDMKEIHERLANWQASHPDSSLDDIQNAVEAEINKLRKQLTQSLVDQVNQVEDQACPNCGKAMMKNGKRKRSLRDKGGESIELEREQLRCHQCGTTFFPPR